ncbi:TRIM2_3 [Mytilus coruscus]|uniref:TRIM2_3 n=1 Tax=Mytilus coruscus TaxID=42192 RepID=A0A6J8D2H0_MYTCO|nr:TRIM2_3 [Mytilus coruscus]
MKDRRAQMMVPKPRKSINDIKLEFKRKLDTTCTYPYGCCATKKGEFLFTNYESNNGKLIVINAEAEVEYTILLKETYRAYDVASLDDSTVAVSTGYSSKQPGIGIVDLTKKKVIMVIDLNNYPYGITYDGKSLICCVGDKDLHVISCTDYSITTIPYTFLPRYSYVSTHADKIFLTNPDKHTVTCCLYSGAQVWEFKDESVLNNPRGITIDNKGNVFVVGMNSCNVVVLSPDGKHSKQILSKEDGLDKPTSIYFDKERKQLLVTNHKQFVYIYNVS